MSAAGIAPRVRDGDYSPAELVDALLERIRARNERTNAFVTVTEDRARQAAKDAERISTFDSRTHTHSSND